MIKAVIFDLDGLLADSEPLCYELYQTILAPYGQSMSLSHYTEAYCGRTAVDNLKQLQEEYHLPLSMEQLEELRNIEETRYVEAGVPAKSGAYDLLCWLKKYDYQILLATSSARERALKILRYNQMEDFFDDMVFGAELKRGKPFPDIFLLAAQKANVYPEECLVLEDSEAGIRAAYTGGLPVICIPDLKRPDSEHEAMTTAVYPSLINVITFLSARKSG